MRHIAWDDYDHSEDLALNVDDQSCDNCCARASCPYIEYCDDMLDLDDLDDLNGVDYMVSYRQMPDEGWQTDDAIYRNGYPVWCTHWHSFDSYDWDEDEEDEEDDEDNIDFWNE